MVLSNIDQIDWASVEHVFGPAIDVPDLLRNLLSADAKVRDHAIYELFGNIWHQGTIYPATETAIPFLFELFDYPKLPDRINVVLLLAEIAAGEGYYYRHEQSGDKERDSGEVVTPAGEIFNDAAARERKHVDACRQLISPRLRDFLPYLSHSQSDVRLVVAHALSCYPEHIDWTEPAVESAIALEQDDYVRTSMLEYLARIKAY